MEENMVNNLISTLDKMKGESTNIWLHGSISLPPIVFHGFNWAFEEIDSQDEFLILYDEQGCQTLVNADEIFEVQADELLNEVIIFMRNESLLQVWCDIT